VTIAIYTAYNFDLNASKQYVGVESDVFLRIGYRDKGAFGSLVRAMSQGLSSDLQGAPMATSVDRAAEISVMCATIVRRGCPIEKVNALQDAMLDHWVQFRLGEDRFGTAPRDWLYASRDTGGGGAFRVGTRQPDLIPPMCWPDDTLREIVEKHLESCHFEAADKALDIEANRIRSAGLIVGNLTDVKANRRMALTTNLAPRYVQMKSQTVHDIRLSRLINDWRDRGGKVVEPEPDKSFIPRLRIKMQEMLAVLLNESKIPKLQTIECDAITDQLARVAFGYMSKMDPIMYTPYGDRVRFTNLQLARRRDPELTSTILGARARGIPDEWLKTVRAETDLVRKSLGYVPNDLLPLLDTLVWASIVRTPYSILDTQRMMKQISTAASEMMFCDAKLIKMFAH